ncbi:MAG: hypothetical protein ACRD0K_27275 [Egibacteraceae bacterium]
MSGGRVAGEPERLEAYTEATQAVLGPTRDSLDDYTVAVRAFLSAQPNDFGVGGVADHSVRLNAILDGLAELDAKPAAFAFALRELDRSAAQALSTTDTALFGALARARADLPYAAAQDVLQRAIQALAIGAGMVLGIAGLEIPGPPPNPPTDPGAGPHGADPWYSRGDDLIVKELARSAATWADAIGWTHASPHLRHYLDNSGADVTVNPR